MSDIKDQVELEAILKYSNDYVLKKKKISKERQLIGTEPRYVIYARKSTDDDKRQVQSVENQIEICKKFAQDNDLKVVDIVREEKSAKSASKREVYNEIIENINNGIGYNSILAWHPDRLSRNMKESGEILDMLDNDILVDLKFPSYSFTNDAAGKMTLSILFAMAKEFSDKLSVDTKRGIEKKVKQGKYCGANKKGYIFNKDFFFIPNKNTFEIYKDIWNRALNGEPSSMIQKAYPDISISVSDYLKDPFPAGIYCFGNQVVNLLEVDPNFVPMITIEDFLSIQRRDKTNRGWHKANEFLPFRDLVKCANCGNYMIPGRSKNAHNQRYLFIACGNKNCKNELKKKQLAISSIRAKVVVDFAIDFLNKHSQIDKGLYDKVIKNILDLSNSEIVKKKDSLKLLKTKHTKLSKTERAYEDELIKGKRNNDELKKRLFEIITKVTELEKEIKDLKEEIVKDESDIALDIPPYKTFVNFFKNIVPAIEKTTDAMELDGLLKLVFLNFSISDKKVVKYELVEPFKSYWSIKEVSGVEDGT